MKKLHLSIILAFACLGPVLSQSTNKAVILNTIPNPNFENTSCCPTIPGQTNCVDSWTQAGSGSSDYLNFCGFTGFGSIIPAPNQPLPSGGNGYMGFFNTSFSNEYVGVCMTAPMTAGTTYSLDLFSAEGDGNLSLDLTVYGTTNCADLPWAGADCPNGIAGWQELGSTTVTYSAVSVWEPVQITFTPSVDINAIAIGPPCGDPVDGGYHFIDGIQLSCVSTLPVDFYTFEIRCQNEFIELNWSTSSEFNNDYFTIERSCDGQNFEVVGTVDGVGNTNQQSDYSFLDKSNNCGSSTTYYRLSQTDYDGTNEYLEIGSGTCKPKDMELFLYNTNLLVKHSKRFDAKVFNAQGQIVAQKLNITGGGYSFDMSSVAKGAYIVEVTPIGETPIRQKIGIF